MDKRNFRLKDFVLPIGVFIGIILVWELIDIILNIKEIILPNPHEIFFAIITNFDNLIFNTWITSFESILGFIIGSVLAFFLATLFIYSNDSKKALYPYAIALKATPLFALAPILVIWFGNGLWSKIIMSAMVAFFPVLVSSVKGLSAIKKESIELFRSYNASKIQLFTKLRFPSSLPYIFPALKIASTLAVVGATIAEFTGASRGIGYLIVNSSYYLDTSIMFAGIIMISLVGILFFYLIDFIEKKIVFW